MIRICFVCHGNICRSPYAEALARKDIEKRNWSSQIEVDSAGTSAEHLGESSHPLSIKLGQAHDLVMNHRARQFLADEFDDWDYIIALDSNNLRNLKKLTSDPKHLEKVSLLREWDQYATGKSVPDPWGRSEEAYEEMADIISSALVEFYSHLQSAHKPILG